MKIDIRKNFVYVAIVLFAVVFCVIVSNRYTNIIICLSVLGFVLSFMAYTKHIIFDTYTNKLVLLNSYFNNSFIERVKEIPLDKYKSCCVSQKNKAYTRKDKPTRYENVYSLRIFTGCGILEPFNEQDSPEKIKHYVTQIEEFMQYRGDKLILNDDALFLIRYCGYSLLLIALVFGVIDYASRFLS